MSDSVMILACPEAEKQTNVNELVDLDFKT